MSGEAGLSEYELRRLKRIEENKSKLRELFPEGMKILLPSFQSNKIVKTPDKIDGGEYTPKCRSATRRRLRYGTRCNPDRRARPRSYSGSSAHRPVTRSQKRRLSDGIDEESDSDDSKSSYTQYSTKRRRIRQDSEALPIQLNGKDITVKFDMRQIAVRSYRKVYDRINGTTCHQCRQKTRDLKTTCHNENCVGVRGQFCGICLKNRYGEEVKDALLDKTWVCPPCRGICNCSFCLPRKGMPPTGIMIHIAKECGYNNVKDYLEHQS